MIIITEPISHIDWIIMDKKHTHSIFHAILYLSDVPWAIAKIDLLDVSDPCKFTFI